MSEMSKAAIFETDGIPQAYVMECDLEVVSNDKEVETLALGLAGFSDGATMGRVNFKAAIPVEGRELDFAEKCARHVTTLIGVRMGGKLRVLKGRFANVKESSSVNNPNALDGSFTGAFVEGV